MASTLYTGGDVMVMDDYQRGFADGFSEGWDRRSLVGTGPSTRDAAFPYEKRQAKKRVKKPRKLSKWQKFVKAKSKLPRFKYKTGKRKGMVNMKAVAAAWKKVPKSKK
jgi:hypothetical protein